MNKFIIMVVIILEFTMPFLNINDKVMKESETLNGKKASYCNPIIPKGFRISKDGASWKYTEDGKIEGWNEGVVVEDIKGNQFVWVPVKDGIGKDGKYTNNNEVKYKKWYASEKKDILEKETKKELENLLGKNNLEDIITEEQIIEDKLPDGVTSEQKQIGKYGGFYIARYEAGMEKKCIEEYILFRTTI